MPGARRVPPPHEKHEFIDSACAALVIPLGHLLHIPASRYDPATHTTTTGAISGVPVTDDVGVGDPVGDEVPVGEMDEEPVPVAVGDGVGAPVADCVG